MPWNIIWPYTITFPFFDNLDEASGNCAKSNKPDTERMIAPEFSHLLN